MLWLWTRPKSSRPSTRYIMDLPLFFFFSFFLGGHDSRPRTRAGKLLPLADELLPCLFVNARASFVATRTSVVARPCSHLFGELAHKVALKVLGE